MPSPLSGTDDSVSHFQSLYSVVWISDTITCLALMKHSGISVINELFLMAVCGPKLM